MGYSKSYNRQSGITYVYETLETHYDPIKKRSVAKRKLIGKIDPVTGEIVPTGPKGRPPKPKDIHENSTDYKALYHEANRKIEMYQEKIQELEDALRRYSEVTSSQISSMKALAASLKKVREEEIDLLQEIEL